MNYQWHYDRLIERARNRVLNGYVETHHVLPRCMGGGDELANLVQLTAEEHYVSHQLLHKIHPHVKGLAFAMLNMTANAHGGRNNKLYGWVRRKVALATSEQMREAYKDPEFVAKVKAGVDAMNADPERVAQKSERLSRANKGRVKSLEERANIAAAGRKRARRVFSAEARANMAAARRKTWAERKANGTDKLIAQKAVATRRANGSYKFSDEWKANIGKAQKGRPSPMKGKVTSPEVRAKQSESAKRRWANHPGLAFPPGTGD